MDNIYVHPSNTTLQSSANVLKENLRPKTLVSQIGVTLFKPEMTNANQYRIDQTLLILKGQE